MKKGYGVVGLDRPDKMSNNNDTLPDIYYWKFSLDIV